MPDTTPRTRSSRPLQQIHRRVSFLIPRSLGPGLVGPGLANSQNGISSPSCASSPDAQAPRGCSWLSHVTIDSVFFARLFPCYASTRGQGVYKVRYPGCIVHLFFRMHKGWFRFTKEMMTQEGCKSCQRVITRGCISCAFFSLGCTRRCFGVQKGCRGKRVTSNSLQSCYNFCVIFF